MIPTPWLILAGVLALAGAFVYGDHVGTIRERTDWTARIEQARAEAAEAARAAERQQQEVVNNVLREQNDRIHSVNAGLRRDLDGLRHRPPRHADPVPEPARAACQGGTGAELSREDAGFLVGEAARADELRAGLAACYAVIDAMNKKGPAP